MAVLSKGTDFGATEQVTSGKLDNLVDAATFVSGGSGTCETGGGLNLSSNGRLQIEDGEIDLVKLSTNNALNSGLYGVLDKVYPVGSIYQSTTQSTTPDALFFGGTGLTTWVALGEGKVLVGIKSSDPDFDAIGNGTNTNGTTGDKTITLEASQIPTHNHLNTASPGAASRKVWHDSQTGYNGTRSSHFGDGSGYAGISLMSSLVQDFGGGGSHSNLQPYEVVYMWKRTV